LDHDRQKKFEKWSENKINERNKDYVRRCLQFHKSYCSSLTPPYYIAYMHTAVYYYPANLHQQILTNNKSINHMFNSSLITNKLTASYN
jgi:hypothetical protein